LYNALPTATQEHGSKCSDEKTVALGPSSPGSVSWVVITLMDCCWRETLVISVLSDEHVQVLGLA
jgi:hypothetical protein